MYGKGLSEYVPATGYRHTSATYELNEFIFVARQGPYYKMVRARIPESAFTGGPKKVESPEQFAAEKYITTTQTIPLDGKTVSAMWYGEHSGHQTLNMMQGSYKVKDVRVDCSGRSYARVVLTYCPG